MHDLTLVGVHDDGEHLMLAGSDGQRYLLRVDDPLRAAVRRDRARLAQLQIEQLNTLRPRDIQAKIRSGRTADEVADEAGVPVEHVRRYEGPVLAEREFVARQARGVRLRRATAGTPGSYPTLEELVTARLAAREVEPASTSWDAWRTDGTWFVRLVFQAAGKERRAEWEYDVQLRHVTALDDEARWLVDEPVQEPAGGRRVLTTVRADGTSSESIRERVYDVEADGGLRPAPFPQEAEDGRAGAAAATVDLLDTLRERRGRRQWVPDAADDPDVVDPLELAVDQLRVRAEALGEPPAAHPPHSRPEELEDAELLSLPDAPPASKPTAPKSIPPNAAAPKPGGKPGPGSQQPVPSKSIGSRTATTPPAPPQSARQNPTQRAATDPLDLDAAAEQDRSTASRRKSNRASVPSWDDIVFGSRRE